MRLVPIINRLKSHYRYFAICFQLRDISYLTVHNLFSVFSSDFLFASSFPHEDLRPFKITRYCCNSKSKVTELFSGRFAKKTD